MLSEMLVLPFPVWPVRLFHVQHGSNNNNTNNIIIIYYNIYLTANGLLPGGSGYNACTWI